jgi:hypothetical protein
LLKQVPVEASSSPNGRRYHRAAIGFCSKAPTLVRLGGESTLIEKAAKAKREEPILRRLEAELRHLRVSRAQRSTLASYLAELGSQIALDARVGLDVRAGDEIDAEAAWNQHFENSEVRIEQARRLGLECLSKGGR